MPDTITAYHDFQSGQRAKQSEVDHNFSNHRGTLLPINEDTATASDNTHDLGSVDHRWRTAYIGSDLHVSGTAYLANAPQVGGFPIDRVKSVATTGAFQLSADTDAVLANMTTSAWTLTLYAIAAGNTGGSHFIKKTDGGTNRLNIVSATTTQLINDTTTQYIARQHNWLKIFNDGANFHIESFGGSRETSSAAVTKSMSAATSTATDVTGLAAVLPTTGKRVEVFLETANTSGGAFVRLQKLTTGADYFEGQVYLYNNDTLAALLPLLYDAPGVNGVDNGFRLAPRHISFSLDLPVGVQSFQIKAASPEEGLCSISFFNVRLVAREVAE